MTIMTCFSEAEFEIISGPPQAGKEEDQVQQFVDFIQESLQFCFVQSDIQATGCSLRYLDTEAHPFIDLGSFYELAGINFETILDLPKEEIIKIELPLMEGAVERIGEVSRILEIPSNLTEMSILAFFRIRLAHKQLEDSLDFTKTKAVIRGTEASIEKLVDNGLHPTNMGGVVDTPESVDIREVWGLDDNGPTGLPKFFVFS